jgi:hypothetical protein
VATPTATNTSPASGIASILSVGGIGARAGAAQVSNIERWTSLSTLGAVLPTFVGDTFKGAWSLLRGK